MEKTNQMVDKRCPWCLRHYLKDDNCNYIFACGLDESGFKINQGCGFAFCHFCNKKFCSAQYNPKNGKKLSTYRDHHDKDCCRSDRNFKQEEFCEGGHNSHAAKRW